MRKLIKVLRVSSDLYPFVVGGIGLHVHEMSKLQEKYGCDITVYTLNEKRKSIEDNEVGYKILSFKPLIKVMGNKISLKLLFKILNSMKPVRISFIKDNKYILYVPVFLEDRCRFCHADANNKNIAGIMKFARDFDSHIYYSSERIIIFIIISLVLIILLYYIIRWEPGKKIRKLFDKQK